MHSLSHTCRHTHTHTRAHTHTHTCTEPQSYSVEVDELTLLVGLYTVTDLPITLSSMTTFPYRRTMVGLPSADDGLQGHFTPDCHTPRQANAKCISCCRFYNFSMDYTTSSGIACSVSQNSISCHSGLMVQ